MLSAADINSIVVPFPPSAATGPATGEYGQFKENGISFLASNNGSVRYLYCLSGVPVAALHITAKDLHLGEVSAAYTSPSMQHAHLIAELLERAKRNFVQLIMTQTPGNRPSAPEGHNRRGMRS